MFVFCMQQELEERAAKPPETDKPISPDEISAEPKQQNIVQIIYAENRVCVCGGDCGNS